MEKIPTYMYNYEMTKNCKQNLIHMSKTGTSLNKQMANTLLTAKINFKNIEELSRIFNSSVSSVSRFVRRLNFPSFKHFYVELVSKEIEGIKINEKQEFDNNEFEFIAEKMTGQINIITSRRDKALGKFINERFNSGRVNNRLFHESTDNMQEYISSIKENDSIILIDILGDSYIISKALTEIARIAPDKRQNIIFLTSSRWTKVFKKYENIYVVKQLQKILHPSFNWDGYNHVLLKIMPLIFKLINIIYDSHKKK